MCACGPPHHLGPREPRLHMASLSHEQEARGCRDTPTMGVSSHPSSLHHTAVRLAFALTRAVVSTAFKVGKSFKVSCGRPMYNMMEVERRFPKQSRESPKGPPITTGHLWGPQEPVRSPTVQGVLMPTGWKPSWDVLAYCVAVCVTTALSKSQLCPLQQDSGAVLIQRLLCFLKG